MQMHILAKTLRTIMQSSINCGNKYAVGDAAMAAAEAHQERERKTRNHHQKAATCALCS